MQKAARVGLLFAACAAVLSAPAFAVQSGSASFSNTRSSLDSGGRRKTSASFRSDGEAAGVAAPSGTSASFSKRDGLMGIDFYPARVSNLWGSSTTAAGGVYLQWTAPGNDGNETSAAKAYIVKYSSVAAQSPATSNANFSAAGSLTPPSSLAGGTLQTATWTGLKQGVSYYFAVEAVEADGLRSVLSAGATVQTAASCPTFAVVDKTNGPYTTIQSALNALPSTLTGYSCVIIEDGSTYNEQVNVRNFVNNGSSITIFADPASGLTPTISPPAGSTAAFVIAQASVNVIGLNIAPANAVTYGVQVSSSYVTLSSVTIQDAAGKIGLAGVSVSNWSTVSYSSVTLGAAAGYWLGGAFATISYSSASVNSALWAGLYVNGGSSNTVTAGYFKNASGSGGVLAGAAAYNTVSFSTFVSAAAEPSAGLLVSNASYNTATQSFFSNTGAGDTVRLSNALGNTLSKITTAGGTFYVVNSTSNLLTQSAITSPNGDGVYVNASNANTISLSTVASASAGGGGAIRFVGASSNVVTQSMISDASGHGVSFFASANANAVLSSTITAAGAGYSGVYASNSSDDSIQGCSVQGPAGANFTNGSARPVVGGSVVSATDPAGGALTLDGTVSGLTVSTSTLIGGAYGVYLGTGNASALVIATNTITGALVGIYVAPQNAAATVWVTSNTVVPTVVSGKNTFGLYFNGLTSGATVESNSVYYRATASAGTGGSYAVYAQNSAGLLVDHNRVDDPGMITGGAFSAIMLTGTTASQLLYNDVFASGTALTNAYLANLVSVSTGVKVRNNVFASSLTVTGVGATVNVDSTSFSGFVADYNDDFSSNTLSLQWGTTNYGSLAAWQAASAQDTHAFSAHPLWKNTTAGGEDFHPLSAAGRWDPAAQAFANDGVTSPTIDAADPADAYGLEIAPNGSRANLGSYGGTAQASRSSNAPGCVVTRTVGQSAGAYASIQAAVNSLPTTFSGPTCVVIVDGATYKEQVAVQGFSNAGYSLTIEPQPGSGLTPVVAPPANSTAAFQIAQATVSLLGVNVIPSVAVTYGVNASSAYVTISSVSVQDPGGLINFAAMAVSSWSAVSYSSITVTAAHGFALIGSTMTSISYSTASANGSFTFDALDLIGASSNTVSRSYFYNTLGNVVVLEAGSRFNTLTDDAMTGDKIWSASVYFNGASTNTVTRSAIVNNHGMAANWNLATQNVVSRSALTTTDQYGAVLGGSSTDNLIAGSTITTNNASLYAAYVNGSSHRNTFAQDVISNPLGTGLYLNAVSGSVVTLSSITSNASGANYALHLLGGSSHSISQTFIANGSGYAAYLESGANGNTISQSTIAGNAATYPALYVTGSSNNTFAQDAVYNPAAAAASLVSGANGNMISGSTFTSAAAGVNALQLTGGNNDIVTQCSIVSSAGYGVSVMTSLNIGLFGDAVQGSTAVFVSGSTGTAIGGGAFTALAAAGDAVYLGGGSVGLALSSSTLAGGAQGAGVRLDAGDTGLIVLSTNQISGARYGLLAGAPVSGALFVTSNTIVPTISGSFDTFGLKLTGLTLGATIQNNGLYYRAPGNNAGFTAYALYSVNSASVNFTRNRIDEPGLVSGGSYAALTFNLTVNSTVTYNDVFSSGTGLTNAYLLQASNASTGLIVRDNVFSSSLTVTGSSATVAVDAGSQAGFYANYNDYFSSNTLAFVWGAAGYTSLAGWQAGSGMDAGSIAKNPLWWSAFAGLEDFHPMSSRGRWNPASQAFVNDGAFSPTIDAGDPGDDFSAELSPNGQRVNQGSYGGTAEASISLPAIVGCTITRNVSQSGPYTTIQSAVNSLPNPLSSYVCVIVRDGATYAEQVTVQGFVNNGSSITIAADPASGVTPVVAPPAGSTAAFQIAQSSVNLIGFNAIPANAITYGVVASSSYVTISTVAVLDAGGKISLAGLSVSSWSAVSNSTVSVAAAHGILLPGSTMTTISYSTITDSGASWNALFFSGASSVTVTQVSASNAAGSAASFSAGSIWNSIAQSTFTSAGGNAVYLVGAASNTFVRDVIYNSNGYAAYFAAGADYNTLSKSSLTTVSNGNALQINGKYNAISQATIYSSGFYAVYFDGPRNTVTQSLVWGPSMGVAMDVNAQWNTISYSTISNTSGGANPALHLTGSANNVLLGDAIWGAGTTVVTLDGGANANTINQSTVTGNGGQSLYLTNATNNTITQSSLVNSTGYAAYLDAGANGNTISLSTASAASSVGNPALALGGGASNTISQSYLANAQGPGLSLTSATGNTVTGSTVACNCGGGYRAVLLGSGSSNVLTLSEVISQGIGVEWDGSLNTISLSTVIATGGDAVLLSGASTDTITQSYLQASGTPVDDNASTGTIISGSALVAASPTTDALWMRGGSVNLTVSSSTLSGGAQAAAVHLDLNGSGLIVVSTNSIFGARYGVQIATQTAAASIYVTSNTVLPTLSASFNTYGVFVNGLTSGATIQSNGIYFRTPASNAGFTAYGVFLQSAAGVVVDHNRIDEPGLISGGSYAALALSGATSGAVTYNDVFSSGAALANVYLLQASNGSTGWKVRDNVFASSVAVTGSSATVAVDAASQAGFVANYNDYFSSNTLSFAWGGAAYAGLPAWQAATGQDARSFVGHPLWFNTAAGAEDFHPLSSAGRWSPSALAFVNDGADSPATDAADPADPYNLELSPNGSRANLGSYGDTAEASKSLPAFAGCSVTKYVNQTSGPYTTIQAAVNALPGVLNGNACVIVKDGATYAEQATVGGFVNNGSSITIRPDPGSGLTPVMAPPAGSTAAFVIAQASVNVIGLNIAPANAVTYGVQASSAYVTLSSVTIQDAAGKIGLAGVSVSSWSTVSYSSVTLGAAYGYVLGGALTTVSYSSASVNSAAFAGLYVNGGSSNTVTAGYFKNASGSGGVLAGAAAYNTVSFSTFVSAAAEPSAGLLVSNASYNTATQSFFSNTGAGDTVRLSNALGNTLSKITTAGGAFYVVNSASNLLTQSAITSPNGDGVYLNASNGNTISLSTVASASAGSGGAIHLVASSSNVVTQSMISDASGHGVSFFVLSNSNAVLASTITAAGAGYSGVYADNSSDDAVRSCSIQGPTGANFTNGSARPVVGGSVVSATDPAGGALTLDGTVSGLTVSTSTLIGGTYGVYLGTGNASALVIATNTITGALVGVYVAPQNAAATVWVTSNTVVPTVVSGKNTFGLYFNGLTSGATVESNSVYYRAAASAGTGGSYAVYAQNSTGLMIDRNRVDDPGMITGGAFSAITLTGTTASQILYNDVFASGTALTNAYFVNLAGASTGIKIRNNVFASSITASGAWTTMAVGATSQSGFAADYNDYFSSSTLAFQWGAASYGSLASWQNASAQDAHAFSGAPLWSGVSAGAEDFHPLSTAGRWSPAAAAFVNDGADSPAIDAADPADAYALETAPNGSRANLGSYGNTAEASRSATVAGCSVVRAVGQTSAAYATIQSALNSLPTTLSGPTCVVVGDNGTYPEQVSVQGFTNNGSSLTIEAKTGFAPVVAPPTNSTAAFAIAQSSVNLFGLTIIPSAALTYGVQASSAYVTISSVSVQDPAGKISLAAVALSSWSAVSYSSVTVGAAHGFYLPGSFMTTVSYSSAQAAGVGFDALYVHGGSSNTFTVVLASNAVGTAALLDAGAAFNSILRSTMASAAAGSDALMLVGASSNTVSASVATNSGGDAVNVSAGSGYNAFVQSAVSSPNAGDAFQIGGSNWNVVRQATITSGGLYAFYLNGSSNTITQSSIAGASWGFKVDSAAQSNTISYSTITQSGGANQALELAGAVGNVVTQDYLAGRVALTLDSGAQANTISFSTMSSTGVQSVYFSGSSNNLLTRSLALSAVRLDANSNANTISFTTMTSGGAAAALSLTGVSGNLITQSYVQGSSAAVISGSTGTVVSASVFVATNTTGDALALTGGSVGLTLSSSLLTAGLQGSAVHIDAGNSGLIVVSTNAMTGGAYGVLAGGQVAGAQIYVTSNTILPSVTGAFDTYGVLMTGLTSGATVQNNGVYYRAAAGNTGATAYAIAAQNSAALNIDHNRVNDPGMVSGGSFVAASFSGTTGAAFKFNDVNVRGAGLTNAFLLKIANASAVTVKDDVFASSVSVTGSSATITVDAGSAAGLASNYNDYFSSNAWNTGVWGGVAYKLPFAWSLATGQDAASIVSNPLWANAAAGAEDFHPLSAVGRCATPGAYGVTCGAFVADGATSATIDAGDPAEALGGPLGTEPAPNGSVVNQGSTGQTADASESAPALCQVTRKVSASGPYISIQDAVNSLPNPLTGYACVLVEDGGTYVEQVEVRNFTMNGSSITIAADPASGLTPVVNPPAASTAAFLIAQSSVNIAGLAIVPGNSVTYGLLASSSSITISSVSVQDPGGLISLAGMSVSSATQVSYSSVTVAAAHGFLLRGATGTTISYSTAQASGGAYAALYVTGSSSNTFTVLTASNTTGDAARLTAGSNRNTIVRGALASSAAGYGALHVDGSTANVIAQSFVSNPAGHGAWLDTGAHGNTISLSTVTSGSVGSYYALYLNGVSSNTVAQSYVFNPYGHASYLNAATYNAVTLSTMASGASGYAALRLVGSSFNTVARSIVSNASGNGAYWDGGSNGNAVNLSTVTSAASGSYALFLQSAASNTFTQSYISNPAGFSAYFNTGADNNAISLSTVASADPSLSEAALYMLRARMNAISRSLVLNPSGNAAALTAGANFNTIVLSTMIGGGSGYTGLTLNAVSSNTIFQSYVQGSTGAAIIASTGVVLGGDVFVATNTIGNALYFGVGGVNLAVSSTTLIGGPQGSGAFVDAGASGAITVSTNLFTGGQYGLWIASPTLTATLFVTSNTVVPTLSAAADTFGLYLDGLASGATIQNNSVYYQAPGPLVGGRASFALYAQSGANLFVDHNRFSQPGMMRSGSYVALAFNGTVNSTVAYNDFFSSGAALGGFSLLSASNTSTGLTVRNNVFASSVSLTLSGSSATVIVDAGSQAGFYANYNDYFSSNTLAFQWGAAGYATLAAWQAGVGQDARSIIGNPMWASTVAGTEDFHPLSTVGRWSPGLQAWAIDGADSPTTDSADPGDPYVNEPSPNGGNANQGSYGNTAEASKATPNFPGCVVTKRVNQVLGPYTSLQSAVNALPASLSGNSCVIVRDGATYAEQVVVRGFTNNGSSITIQADPATGLTPAVNPPAGTAAFVIANSSVALIGVAVTPANAISYGVLASSSNVSISSVAVLDAGGRIAIAGVSLSSWSAVSYSTVSVAGVQGVLLTGAGSTVSFSSAAAVGPSAAAVYVNGAASAALVGVAAFNPSGTGIKIRGAASPSVTGSFVQASTAVAVSASSNLTLAADVLVAAAQGFGVDLDVGNSGSIVLATNTISGGAFGLYVAPQAAGARVYVASNTILASINSAWDTYGLFLDGLTGGLVENNAVYYRTAASNAGHTAYALYARGGSGLVVDRNRINEPGLVSGGAYQAMTFNGAVNSTVTYNDASAAGLGLSGFAQLAASNGSTGLMLRNNVFSSSVTVTGSSETITVDAGSAAGLVANYNDYFSSNTLGFQLGAAGYASLAAWQTTGQDAGSISVDPLWESAAPGAEDFHPKSAAGRYSPAAQAFVADAAVSKTIDAGDPADSYAAETAPNGGRANQGSFGGTAEASHAALPPSNVSLAGVWTSSAALQFTGVAAFGYDVDASTDPLFGSVVSAGSPSATTLAPQGLFANTTYYLRAGALWGATTVYAQTIVSTPTMSNLISGATTYAVYATSVIVNWIPLPASPSSATAEGYILQASTASDFTGTVFLSQTAGVQPSTMTLTGLTDGGSYYFRIGTINWDGVPNYASTLFARLNLADVWPPSPVTDLTASSTSAEGQMVLQWTAPDGNGYVFGASVPAAGYLVRIATFSISGVGGSTTTWWNLATDVRNLPAPAISTAPPSPAFPGTTQYLTINQLWPGVTYYAMIISTDQAGNVSGGDLRAVGGLQASALPLDVPPPAPLGLTAAQTARTKMTISWNAVAAYDLDYYKVAFDSTPPYDFSHSSTTMVVAPSTYVTLVGLSSGTYNVRVTAVDRGQPRSPGVALESVAASSVVVQMVVPIRPPEEPFGVGISTSLSGVTVTWMPSMRYADGGVFAVSTAPTQDECAYYLIYRATSPILGSWTNMGLVYVGSTLTFTDAGGDPSFYYTVRAVNSTGTSPKSVIRTASTGSAYLVAPDDRSYFEIPIDFITPLQGSAGDVNSAYLVHVSSVPQDLGTINGRVVKSLEFDAFQGGLSTSTTFTMPGPGILHLHYDTSDGTHVTVSATRLNAFTASNMSAFWYNGQNWVQLYGTLDTVSQTVTIQTKFVGKYQLRAAERTGGFSFNQAGVSNRFITPNGDKKNDNVVFTYDNPQFAAVTGKILDLRGRTVVSSLPPGPTSNSLMWNGTSGGALVAGGVYIYQIQAQGQTYTGTIVVIR